MQVTVTRSFNSARKAEICIAVQGFILQILILVVSQKSPVYRGDVISMLGPMLKSSRKIQPWFAKATYTHHALVSTDIKGRDVVAAVPTAVEEVFTKS